MYVITDRCDRCGYCVLECALDAIEKGQVKHRILPDRCTDCGACIEVCPIEAIEKLAGPAVPTGTSPRPESAPGARHTSPP